ncbi:Ff.00g035260.m01.CDS01 [Fusarium sp. VM40]|nr:Ff.00g035260.m01.CDS01 [Fusarium sp. VM40]
MAFSTPFERLPVEIIISIIGDLESPEALQAMIRADSHILRVFIGNRHLILRPLRQDVYHQFPDKNFTQAAISCRLRQIESGVPPRTQTRAHAEEMMRPLLSQSPKPLSVAHLSLGAISKLYELFREAEIFTAGFSRECWQMFQDWVSRENDDYDEDHVPQKLSSIRLPLSLPLSKTECYEIQRFYSLFDVYRHTLNFTTSFLQDYDLPEPSSSKFHILYRFIYQDKLLCVRAFQTVLRFVFREYEHLLNGIHDRIACCTHLHRPGTSDTPWLRQRQEFLDRSPRDHVQFIAYLCSQGYYVLLRSQDMDSITREERILSLYMRFSQFKENILTCPLVISAHLEFALNKLCHGTDLHREFWASGSVI